MDNVILRYIATGQEPSNWVPSAFEYPDGSRISLISADMLRAKFIPQLSSYEQPVLSLPEPVDVAQHKGTWRPDSLGFWKPIAESLAYAAIAPLALIPSGDAGKGEIPTKAISIPFGVARDGLDAVARFQTLTGVLRRAWTWVLPDLGKAPASNDECRTTALPPPDMLPELASAAEGLSDPLSRLLALGVAHAIGQETAFLHAGWGQAVASRSEARQKHWYEVQAHWLSFLEARLEKSIQVRVVLTGIEPWQQFATSWLPVASLRAVGVQLKRNLEERKREDFITRMGMALPWDNQTRWAVKSHQDEGAAFCDAWPCPLDHLRWWQGCLEAIALKLFEEAVDRSTPSAYRVLDLSVPFYRQSLAALLAVARPLGQHQSKDALTAASLEPLEIAAAPNYLIPHVARLISLPHVVRPSDFSELAEDPSRVVEGVATPAGPGFTYPHIALLLQNANPEMRVVLGGSQIEVRDAGRNLGRDVKWAVGQMKVFRGFQRREAEMFLWWRDLLADAPTSLDFAFGSGWVWNPSHTMNTLTMVDYPPSARCKLGWLAWVIAMWARNEKLPPNLAIPSTEELDAVGVEDELSYEAHDVMAQRAGTPDVMDPFHGQRRPSRGRPLRLLALQGWFGKADAQTRLLQWLALHPPQPKDSWAFMFTAVCCSIAAARWVHEFKDQKVMNVLRHVQKAAEGNADRHAVNGAAWLEAYLSYVRPFPTK